MLRIVLLFLVLSLPAHATEPAVTPTELAAQIAAGNAPLILDVRTQEEFDAGHVPGAVLIPHDQIEARMSELGEPRDVVVYCRSGRRSALVEPALEKQGFRVHQLDGSWLAWDAAGLPEEKNEDTTKESR